MSSGVASLGRVGMAPRSGIGWLLSHQSQAVGFKQMDRAMDVIMIVALGSSEGAIGAYEMV